MKQELELFKTNKKSELESDYLQNDNNVHDISTEKNNLEIKKKKIESDIRIQKEINKNKKQTKLEKSKNTIKEDTEKKKLSIELDKKKEINSLNKNFELQYQQFVNELKLNSNNNENIHGIDKNYLNNLLTEYKNELEANFEHEKKNIEIEYQNNLIKDLNDYKIKSKKEKDENIKKIYEDTNNLEQNYYTEIDIIKKTFNQMRDREDENMKKKIFIITDLFEKIKNENIKKANEEIQEIKYFINNIYQNKEDNIIYNSNNYDKEDIELKIEDLITNKLDNKKMKINELQFLIDIIERDYINRNIHIEFISQSLLIICRLLNEKSPIFDLDIDNNIDTKNKDDLLVNDILQNIKNKCNEFQIKYEDNKKSDNNKNKSYQFLNEEVKKMLDIINKFNFQNKINNFMLYSFNKNKFNMNNNYNPNSNVNSNSASSRINYSSNLYNHPNNIMSTNYNDNNYNNIINPTISQPLKFRSPINPNKISYSNNFNYIQSNPQSNINRNINSNNNIDTNQNGLNSFKSNYTNENNINNENDNEQLLNSNKNYNNNNNDLNISNNYDDGLPELPQEILDTLYPESLNLYNSIRAFLIQEMEAINAEKMDLDKKKVTNDKLKELKNLEELDKYNDLLSQIYTNEKNNSNKVKKKLEDKLNILNTIKLHWKDTINFIYDNSSRQDIIKYKLNILQNNIDDYKSYITASNRKDDNYFIESINIKRNGLNWNVSSRGNNYNRNRINDFLNDRYGYSYNYNLNEINKNKINTFRMNNSHSINNNPINLRNYNQNNEGVDRYNYHFNP